MKELSNKMKELYSVEDVNEEFLNKIEALEKRVQDLEATVKLLLDKLGVKLENEVQNKK
jgi:hypothetical protein